MFFFKRKPQRLLFHYWDGERKRAIDPQQAWLDLWNGEGDCDPEADIGACRNPPDGALDVEAHNRLRNKICQVFGVQAFDPKTGKGLTIDELFDLLGHYFVMMNDLKKKRDLWQAQLPPTGSTSSDNQSTTQPESG